MIGLLNAVPRNQLHHGVIAKVTCLQQIGVELGRGTVQIAIGGDVRQTTLEAPMVVDDACAETQRLLM